MAFRSDAGTLDELFVEMTKHRIRDVVDDDQWNPVVIGSNDSVTAAFQMMSDEGILSLPVVNNQNHYVGFIEMQDVIEQVLSVVDNAPALDYSSYTKDWFRASASFQSLTVKDVKHRQLRKEVHPNFSLYHAYENLARHGDHRIALLSSNRRVLGVISQKMILDWINKNIHLLKTARFNTIRNIRPYTNVISVRGTEIAARAFRKMSDNNVSGIAIVDENNRLIDVLSERDLKGIEPGTLKFRYLFKSVASFKEKVREADPTACPIEPQYVLSTASLGDVISMLGDNDIHRVFVCNNHIDKRVMDVVSMTDVLEYLAKESAVSTPYIGRSNRV